MKFEIENCYKALERFKNTPKDDEREFGAALNGLRTSYEKLISLAENLREQLDIEGNRRELAKKGLNTFRVYIDASKGPDELGKSSDMRVWREFPAEQHDEMEQQIKEELIKRWPGSRIHTYFNDAGYISYVYGERNTHALRFEVELTSAQ
jgi:hypothetical protein